MKLGWHFRQRNQWKAVLGKSKTESSNKIALKPLSRHWSKAMLSTWVCHLEPAKHRQTELLESDIQWETQGAAAPAAAAALWKACSPSCLFGFNTIVFRWQTLSSRFHWCKLSFQTSCAGRKDFPLVLVMIMLLILVLIKNTIPWSPPG